MSFYHIESATRILSQIDVFVLRVYVFYREVLNERTDPKLSTECIMEALDICNIAQFDVTWYRQTVVAGCSYGPHDSCPYADMAMGEINNKVHSDSITPTENQTVGQDTGTISTTLG